MSAGILRASDDAYLYQTVATAPATVTGTLPTSGHAGGNPFTMKLVGSATVYTPPMVSVSFSEDVNTYVANFNTQAATWPSPITSRVVASNFGGNLRFTATDTLVEYFGFTGPDGFAWYGIPANQVYTPTYTTYDQTVSAAVSAGNVIGVDQKSLSGLVIAASTVGFEFPRNPPGEAVTAQVIIGNINGMRQSNPVSVSANINLGQMGLSPFQRDIVGAFANTFVGNYGIVIRPELPSRTIQSQFILAEYPSNDRGFLISQAMAFSITELPGDDFAGVNFGLPSQANAIHSEGPLINADDDLDTFVSKWNVHMAQLTPTKWQNRIVATNEYGFLKLTATDSTITAFQFGDYVGHPERYHYGIQEAAFSAQGNNNIGHGIAIAVRPGLIANPFIDKSIIGVSANTHTTLINTTIDSHLVGLVASAIVGSLSEPYADFGVTGVSSAVDTEHLTAEDIAYLTGLSAQVSAGLMPQGSLDTGLSGVTTAVETEHLTPENLTRLLGLSAQTILGQLGQSKLDTFLTGVVADAIIGLTFASDDGFEFVGVEAGVLPGIPTVNIVNGKFRLKEIWMRSPDGVVKITVPIVKVQMRSPDADVVIRTNRAKVNMTMTDADVTVERG
jgi:hypothetical protein